MKRTGRPPVKDRFREERRILAGLIDDALRIGQRGDGTPRKNWHPWTEVEFANKVGMSASMVGDWRDRDNPARPGNIEPILKVLYGGITVYAAERQAMKNACAGYRRASSLSVRRGTKRDDTVTKGPNRM